MTKSLVGALLGTVLSILGQMTLSSFGFAHSVLAAVERDAEPEKGETIEAGVPQAVREGLTKIANAESKRDRVLAIRSILSLGEAAVPALVEEFPKSDENLKGWIAYLLARMKSGKKAKDVLLAELKEKKAKVNPEVIKTLGMLKERRATPLLIALLSSNDESVPHRAVYYALSRLQDPRSADVLLKGMSSRDIFIRKCSFYGISGLLDELRNAEESKDAYNLIIEALYAKIRSEENPDTLSLFLNLLSKIRTDESSRIAARFLTHPSVRVRIAAVKALGRIGGYGVAEKVEPLLRDEAQEVQIAAIQVLKNARYEEAVPTLIEMLRSDERIREEAHKALKVITGKNLSANPTQWEDWFYSSYEE